LAQLAYGYYNEEEREMYKSDIYNYIFDPEVVFIVEANSDFLGHNIILIP